MICPRCGSSVEGNVKFCSRCGNAIQKTEKSEGFLGGLRTKVKVMGDKATSVTKRAGGMVSPERASEAVRNMVNLILQVASNVRKEIPPEMVKAVDISAEISFIAFSIGVSVDLEQIQIEETQ